MQQTEWLTEEKLADFHEGRMIDAYRYFGSHCSKGETVFTVWVPDVKQVTVVGMDLESGTEKVFQLEQHPSDSSIWQVRIAKKMTGFLYQYEIETARGEMLRKSDPYAQWSEMRPGRRSIVTEQSAYIWSEEALQQKKNLVENHAEKPMAIYEVHIGAWRRNEEGGFLNYREVADQLIPYVKECGFTHIEILPITEHPLDESWGYQTTGFFAPTSRYGTADDLKYLVEQCAQNGIGLFLDWIPGHFCQDDFALAKFNGSLLYEEKRADRMANPDWGTLNFDIRKGEVVSFLLSSAHYWLEEFKFDGYRMDALVSLLFIPNVKSRPHNEEGADFLRKLTTSLRQHFPDALLIGEDAWHFPKVTSEVEEGGVGFHYKWNFGWMRDFLDYMAMLPSERSDAHKNINFSMVYYYDDRFILTFSHDEVVNGRKSLLSKMPGKLEEQFRQLRLLLGYWITHPGKKLLFMGQEFGQLEEWKLQPELPWSLLEDKAHRQMQLFTKEILFFYRNEKALYELDDQRPGFLWLDPDNHEQSIASFIRRGRSQEDELVVICNYSDRDYPGFSTGVPKMGSYVQIFSTEDSRYGGTVAVPDIPVQAKEVPHDGQKYSIEIEVPAFSMNIWKINKKGREA